MPIEIRELVIRATVEQKGGDKRQQSVGKTPPKEDIVSECVEQVLEVLRRRQER